MVLVAVPPLPATIVSAVKPSILPIKLFEPNPNVIELAVLFKIVIVCPADEYVNVRSAVSIAGTAANIFALTSAISCVMFGLPSSIVIV